MTSRIKDDIKSFFQTGDKPTESQFIDFIDSYVDMAGPMGTLQAQVSAGAAGVMIAAGQTASIAPYSTIRDSQGITVYTTALSTGIITGLVATTAQAQAGTDNSTLMNPVLVKAAIAALSTSGSSTLKFTTTTGALTLDATHNANIVQLTGSTARTFAFTAAATLTNGWWCIIENSSTAELTVDPNSSELIDGLSTYIMYPGEVRIVQCTGSAFNTILTNGGTATLTGSGTWIRAPGYSYFDVEVCSSGQNGASRSTTGNAGGGGGGYVAKYRVPASYFVAAGSTETITVGGTVTGVTGNTNGTAANFSAITINGVAYKSGDSNTVPTNAANGGAVIGGTIAGFSTFNGSTYAVGLSIAGNATIGANVTSGNVPTPDTYANGLGLPGAGGGCASTAGGTRTGGGSTGYGAGGAGGSSGGSGSGVSGTAPGGGGGGSCGGTSGGGAAGQVIIRGII